MTTYVLRNGELIEKSMAGDVHEEGPRLRYISDHMDALKHMANGRVYDSKSEFRKATKAAGCVEVGDQSGFGTRRQPIKLDKRERVEHIKRAIYELQNGRRI